MSDLKSRILDALSRLNLPDGANLVSSDMVRALTVEEGAVRFVIEAPSPELAARMEPVRQAAEAAVRAMPGVAQVSAVLTAHGPSARPQTPPPSLKVGGHPKPQAAPMKPAGVKRILAIGSGKGGVGKSTVSSNLALALTRQGRKGWSARRGYLWSLAAAHDGRNRASRQPRR